MKEISLKEGERVLIRTGFSDYHKDCIEVLAKFLKSMDVIIITFDTNIRDIVDGLLSRGVKPSRIHIIDCVSITLGRGSAPVSKLINIYRPEYFVDIQVYTFLFLKEARFRNTVIFFHSMHELEEYQNFDEIGLFLFTFREFIKKHKIPQVIMEHDQLDYSLAKIIEAHAERVVEYGVID
ncbi:MAG: hypothetical protein KJ709_01115 [Nanoarchaeota archaeon]|nr:hypothetical protein [Nanoarchaeota archaeon]